MSEAGASRIAGRPRIVNPIFFVRGLEPRSNVDLVEPVRQCISLLKRYGLRGTILLQYDALVDEKLAGLVESELPEGCEIGAWLELVQSLVEAAGGVWTGRWPWDWESNHSLPIGYPLDVRERIADAYMAAFHRRFGRYPSSLGAWVLDAHTLGHIADRYPLVAACDCKDQVGTDGYTVWGGYWNQGYYPSRRNANMPAQTPEGSIPVPVFRMLGSDPIYQYDLDPGARSQGVVTLEPVYAGGAGGGGRPDWVRWFFDMTTREACGAFAYVQMGQENSFGWPAMQAGLEDQFAVVAELARSGAVRVETLGETGAWFRGRFPVTPSTAVTATTDWRGKGRATAWYDSRFYRANLFWEAGAFRIRDIHLFDERVAERYLTEICAGPKCEYDTLPVMDGYRWSSAGIQAGIDFEACDAAGRWSPVQGGAPEVRDEPDGTLVARWSACGGSICVTCRPEVLTVAVEGAMANSQWRLAFRWAPDNAPASSLAEGAIRWSQGGSDYDVAVIDGRAEGGAQSGELFVMPEAGRISLDLTNGRSHRKP